MASESWAASLSSLSLVSKLHIFWGTCSLSRARIRTNTHTHSMWVSMCTVISSLVGVTGDRFGSQRLPDVYWEQECCLPFLPGVLLEWQLGFALPCDLFFYNFQQMLVLWQRLKSRMLVLRCPHPHLDLGGPVPCICRLFFWSSVDGEKHTANQHSCLNHPLQPFWHCLFVFEFLSSCARNKLEIQPNLLLFLLAQHL